MNNELPAACIFEGNEMGNNELNWIGLIISTAHSNSLQ